MKYLPAAVASADLDVAQSPYFGGEFGVYLTTVAAVLIGEIDLSAATVGTYADNPATTLPGATDLQMVAVTPILSAVALAITLSCHDNTGTPIVMNGVATFSPPARAANQGFNFGRGYAVDLVPATGGKLFTSVDSLGTIVGGGANQIYRLYQLPAQSDYTFIGCTTEIDFNTKSRVAKGVDCGMESDAFVKRGKTQPGELNIGSKFKSFAEGMARFDGLKTTAMLVGVKDGQVTGDRLVFAQYVPTVKAKLPDGDGEAMCDAIGKFVEHMFFVAP